jgi:hypothetical protein
MLRQTMRYGLALFLGLCSLFLTDWRTALAQDLYYGGFEGRWEGALRSVEPSAYDSDMAFGGPSGPQELAISISGPFVRVFVKERGDWREVKPGAFKLLTHKTTALIVAIDSAADVMDRTGLGGWVESWSLTLSHNDRESVRADLVRSVNNYLRPFDYRNADGKRVGRFVNIAFGELHRVDPR